MISIFNKLFEAITKEDLQFLIDQEVAEDQNLEYKSQPYGYSDENVREMLRDITSIANSYGGYIFLGIEEDKDNTGLPTKLIGIDNADKERDRIYSSCLVNIKPRLSGLQLRTVDTETGKSILAIFIPRSTRAPHMITFKGLNQFWIRHDRQKSKMSIEEIREAFLKTENILQDIQGFLQKRRIEILKEIVQHPYYVIGSSPLLVKEDIIDIFDQRIRDLLKNPPGQRHGGWNLDFGINIFPHPTIYGLKIEIEGFKSVELFRNGYFEVKIAIEEDSFVKEKVNNHLVLDPYPVVEYPVSFIRSLKVLREYLGIEEPFIMFTSLFNIQGFGLRQYGPNAIGYRNSLQIWHKKHLEIMPSQISFQQKPDIIAKFFVDRIWQAFEYEQAPLFDKEGNFNPKG